MPDSLPKRDFYPEFEFNTSRSGGAGGQHVNKVSSKVELRFAVEKSGLLTDEEKTLVREKLANKITSEGYLQIISQTERSQLLNKQLAVRKFYQLLEKALAKPKARKPTKPSKAAVRKRLQTKHQAAEKKASRQQRFDDGN